MKKIIFTVASLALLGSCTRGEVTDVNVTPSDRINFNITTTRAAITTVADMHEGFRVFGTSAGAPDLWLTGVDGENDYRYAGGNWGFTDPVAWPETTGAYPVNFYAWYPAEPAGMGALTATPGVVPTLTASYTVAGVPTVNTTADELAALQEDLVVSSVSTDARPATGRLTMTFEHALSKVDFGIVAGQGATVAVQALGIYGVADTRTFDFVAGDWTADEPQTNNIYPYPYFGNNSWIMSGGAQKLPVFHFPTGGDEPAAVPFYTGVHGNHLMMMPQTSPTIDVDMLPSAGGRIHMLYRMTVNQPNGYPRDEVGFQYASDHPDYAGSALEASGYDGPLYALVVFPLPEGATQGNFTWEPGKGYTYNIGLGIVGGCNGYLDNSYYLDENGKNTGLHIVDGRGIGEPLNDGEIHVELTVTDWGDQIADPVIPSTVSYTPDVLRLPAMATGSTVESFRVIGRNHAGGPDNTVAWTLTPADTWLKLSLNADGSDARTTLSGTGAATVYLVVDDTFGDDMQTTIRDASGADVVWVNLELWGGSNDILYRMPDGTLGVHAWDNSTVTISNMAFFKFGSVVGLSGVGAWDNSGSILFNPTATTSYPYADVPRFTTADSDAGYRNVSVPEYHNAANVLLGKGDPCRLVGFKSSDFAGKSAAQVEAMLAAGDAGWRMPTVRENAIFVVGPDGVTWETWGSGYYQYSGDQGYDHDGTHAGTIADPHTGSFPLENSYYPAMSKPVPCAGYRNQGSGNMASADGGFYWSGTWVSSTSGYAIAFANGYLAPVSSFFSFDNATPIRCVKP